MSESLREAVVEDPTNTGSACRPRIVFIPYVQPDGQVQTFPDDVCSETERVEIEDGWAHIVDYEQFGGRCVVRSYPAHVVSSVIYRG